MGVLLHDSLYEETTRVSAPLVSPKGRSPLSCAAEAGNCDIVSYLLACQHTRTDGSLVFTSPEGSGISEVREGSGISEVREGSGISEVREE